MPSSVWNKIIVAVAIVFVHRGTTASYERKHEMHYICFPVFTVAFSSYYWTTKQATEISFPIFHICFEQTESANV